MEYALSLTLSGRGQLRSDTAGTPTLTASRLMIGAVQISLRSLSSKVLSARSSPKVRSVT